MSKILIADDEIHIRRLLEFTLEDLETEGVELLFAENGRQAMEIMEKDRPDLVFLDIMMPEMNGYDVCRAIKQSHPEIYIFLLTAKGQEYDKKKGIEVGADYYITKPFDPDDIIELAEKVLREKNGIH